MWKTKAGEVDEITQKLIGLNETIATYEADLVKLKSENEAHEVVKKKQQQRIDAYEKKQQQLQKKILSLESAMQLEKKGYEGVIKKCGLLEFEIPDLKAAIKNFKEESLQNRTQLAQYETDLNNDRAKRLQITHENQVLVDRNAAVEKLLLEKEAELLKSQKSQLSNLQQLDSSTANSGTLQAIITEQNNSIITMCNELQGLQTQCRSLTTINQGNSTQIAELLLTVRSQEDEIQRLRGIILGSTNNNSTATRAGTRAGTRGGTRGGTLAGTMGSVGTFNAFGDTNGAGLPRPFTQAEKGEVYRNRVSGSHAKRKFLNSTRPNRNNKDNDDSEYSDDITAEWADATGTAPPASARDTRKSGQFSPLRGNARLSTSNSVGSGIGLNGTNYVAPSEELRNLATTREGKREQTPLSPLSTPYMPVKAKIKAKNEMNRCSTASGSMMGTGRHQYDDSGSSKSFNEVEMSAQSLPNLLRANARMGGGMYSGSADATLSQSYGNLTGLSHINEDKGRDASKSGVNLNKTAPVVRNNKKDHNPTSESEFDRTSTSTARSKFVGQGLGLKHSAGTQYNLPKGSTKSMLQKILSDFE